MARKAARPAANSTEHLTPLTQDCPACGHRLWADYRNRRTVATLDGLVRLTLDIRRCHHPGCPRHLQPYRPSASGRYGWRWRGQSGWWQRRMSRVSRTRPPRVATVRRLR